MSRWLVGSSSSSSVGLRDQRARQQHAAPPAARQRVDRGVGRQLEARQHQLDALLEAPAVALLELVLQRAEPLERAWVAVVGHLDSRVMVGLHQRREIAEPLGDDVEDRRCGRERHVLHEPGSAAAGLAPHAASVGRQLAARGSAAAWTCRRRSAR